MKYICLDIGNVLCTVDMEVFIKDLSETFDISKHDAQYFLRRFQRIHDLGYTTMEDELKEKFNVKSEYILNRLVQVWNGSVQPHIPILDALNELTKSYSLQVALLSNIGVEHAAMMESKLKHDGFFDGAIKHFSCDVGARKPSMIYYQSFLTAFPEFKGSLYVDDLQENLDVGAKLGLKPFKFDLSKPGVEDKIKEIEKIIISG